MYRPCYMYFKVSPKMGGYVDMRILSDYMYICISVSVKPLCHSDTLYLHIHLVRYPLNNRHWIHYDMHLKQHIKYIVCLFVIPKAPEGRRANKRDNYESAFPAFSGIQLQSNRVFCSYSVWTFYFTNEMHLVLFPGQSLRSY